MAEMLHNFRIIEIVRARIFYLLLQLLLWRLTIRNISNINWNISAMEDRMQEFRRRISSTHPPQLGYHHPEKLKTDDDENEKKGMCFAYIMQIKDPSS